MTITRVGGSPVDDANHAMGLTPAVPYAAVAAGRLAVITATATDSAAALGGPGVWRDLTADAKPWVLLVDHEGGLPFDPATHNNLYPHRTAIWYRELDGTEVGSVVVGNGTFWTSVTGVMDVYETDQAGWAPPVVITGESVTHANGRSHAMDSVLALAADDYVHVAFGTDRNGTVVNSAATITSAGVTFGAVTITSKQASSTGDDSTTIVASAPVITGATAVPTVGFTQVQANCGPSLVVRLRGEDASGQVVTPSGIASQEAFGTPTIIQPGQVITPLGIPGIVVFGTPTVQGGADEIHITPGGIASEEAFGSPTVVQASPDVFDGPPCNWEIISCGEYPEGASVELINRGERWAAELLYMRSGQQFPGCPITIRPCQSCSGGSYEEWPVQGQGGWNGSWVPFLWAGAWSNLPYGCGCAGMHTCSPPQVWLPTEAVSITSVKVDGVTLPPSAYEVDNGAWLVRRDGQGWPTTQDLGLPDGEPGTFSITYVPGPPVPLMGKIAAGALALEFVRSCMNLPCRLPAGVQTITRQGVEMTLIGDEDTSWLTGVKEADDFLNTYNPKRRARGWSITSPDIQPPRQTTWSTL
jgi:hypothetical protein